MWCCLVELEEACTRNVRSIGDRPIFSVSVAGETAHTGVEVVWRVLSADQWRRKIVRRVKENRQKDRQ